MYGYDKVLEDYLVIKSVQVDSLLQIRTDFILAVLETGNKTVSIGNNFNSAIYNELRKAVNAGNKKEINEYLAYVEEYAFWQKEELSKLNRKVTWLAPIAIVATFFVLFYGITQVVRIK